MELLQLNYFCDSAESENFSHTAQKYGVPTSNISQTVKRLERELGVSLFRRSANRIRLSEEGRVFYEGAKRALSALAEAKGRLVDMSDALTGEIRLLIRTNRRIVTLAIEEFKKQYPGVQIVINHDTDTTLRDYSFIISDAEEWRDGYSATHLLTERIMLAVNRKSPLASASELTLSSLCEQRFISMAPPARLHRMVSAMCREAGFTPNVVISTPDPYYVRKYVEMDLGVALVPEISWRGLFSENTLLLDIGDYRRDVFMYLQQGRTLTRAESIFSVILRRIFADEAGKQL